MLKSWNILTAAVFLTLPAGTASALPVSGLQPPSNIIQVAEGCGPGRYRGPGGFCHPFGWAPGPEACGPGRYRGPGGFCHPIGWGPGPAGLQWQGCPAGYHLGWGGKRCWPN